ncbi:Syntaxin-11 [Channa argus]|uniref:Syntaxin-11 n=1 Tax=Channa argus TaxID=215402 RepID=A0A6G1QF36_CHAAH|nr:Syntaxin-11 [Channa argus]
MRDRLKHLHQLQTDLEGFTPVELDNLSSQPDQHLDCVLQKAQQIRTELQQIKNDISELKDVNYQALNKTSYPVVAKRDSSSIGIGIKHRGETVLQQLHMMNALRKELGAHRGTSDAAARIALTQYQCLSNALREVMFSYSDTEMNHREACKHHIQRQMEVVGREASEEELEEMMEREDLNVFSIQVDGKTTHSAFLQIESRHKELLELQKRMEAIQELFLDVALLTEEQGVAVENIQSCVQNSEVATQESVVQVEKALVSYQNNPFKKMFCGCFPCYNK